LERRQESRGRSVSRGRTFSGDRVAEAIACGLRFLELECFGRIAVEALVARRRAVGRIEVVDEPGEHVRGLLLSPRVHDRDENARPAAEKRSTVTYARRVAVLLSAVRLDGRVTGGNGADDGIGIAGGGVHLVIA